MKYICRLNVIYSIRMKHLLLILLAILLVSCNRKNIEETEICQWRGENRSGIYPETGLLKEWPEEGPEELWFIDGLGNGYGSPVIAGEKLFITGEIDSMLMLHCFDLAGNPLWHAPVGKEWVSSFPGSRSAPTIVGELIYVGTGMGNLYCLSSKDGSIRWSRDFQEDFQGQYPLHGHAEAPVVDLQTDRVFWTPGGKDHNAVALDRFTGELIWNHPGFGERSAYNMGNLVVLPERSIFVTFSAYHLMGFDTQTGEMLWSQEQDNLPVEQRDMGYGDTHPNSVIWEPGTLYYAASDGNDGVRLQLSADGSVIEEVWRTSEFDCFMGGIVKIGDYLYGTGDARKQLLALDVTTGQLTDSLNIGWGAIIEADHMLYYYNQQGALKLIDYHHGKLQEVSSFRIRRGTREHFSHPVIHQGVLYQRHGQVLMAFDISFS